MEFYYYNGRIMNNSVWKYIGILAVVIITTAVLLLVEVQPRVGTSEAIASETGQVDISNVKIAIVMSEWGFIVDGQIATISSDGTLKGALPISVKVGDVVEITLSNTGEIIHDFNIALGEGEHHHEGMEHQAESTVLNPGETEILTFVAETAGQYTYHCGVPGHTELGMLGSFVIIAEDGGQEHDDDEKDHEEEEHHGE